LFGTITRRTADLTASMSHLAVVATGPGLSPSLVSVLPKAVIELVELRQPIGVVLLFGEFTQAVEPCKAMPVLALDPDHLCV
jgi:hypothetical protein